jgi:hypothetical protein
MIMILKLVIILEEAITVVETISVTLQVMLQKIQSMVVLIINDRQMGMMVVDIKMHLSTYWYKSVPMLAYSVTQK